MSSSPKIKLYTNHGCPWAHRAHIALAELGLPYEEEIIDLAVPRTPEYLKVNPRGLVPSLSYDGEIITESAVVAQFLADAHPSHLQPAVTAGAGDGDRVGAALHRARVSLFVDTYLSRAGPFASGIYTAKSQAEVEDLAARYVDVVAKEVEPLLKDAAPYFGGSAKPTMAEVLLGSFTLRVFAFAKHELLPPSLPATLEERAPSFSRWAQAVNETPSVKSIWDEDYVVKRTKWRIANRRGINSVQLP